ncbi:unnamed protein product [Peronospora farinosa]|uniref:Uncharacterized protein n=1 Tax=Peronospora farinosa TaxID=134698 RepID=A0AAV0TV82_9STRA|nr:unnamed protein product [Peronospora farinosa]CAI5727716.1 unnamed protein product [Peronospora farinosa]
MASNSNSSKDDLESWMWSLIVLAIVFVVGLLLFIINFFKNRPLRGDNRREVAQTRNVGRPKTKNDVNLLPIVPCKSQARNEASNCASITRSHDTNPSQISGFSGGSYRTDAGNQMNSTLTDTEIVTQERAFSPIGASSHSAPLSDYTQGVETSTMSASPSEPDRHLYPSCSSYSHSSDNNSFSSQLTVNGLDTETGTKVSPRKSDEF